MKKSYKIILSVLISFVFVLSPILLAGCRASVNDVSITAIKAAESYFKDHKEVEDFHDITLRWTAKTIDTEKASIEYKLNANDEEYTEGKFESTVKTIEENVLSIKNTGETLIAKLVKVKTTTEHYFELDEDDTLREVTTKEVDTDTYLAFQYQDESNVKSILLQERSEVIDDEDEYFTKYKYELNNDDFDYFVQDYLFTKTNRAMKNQFFDLNGEILMFYQALMKFQKNGNKVKVNIGMNNVMYVDGEYDVTVLSSNTDIYYKNNKAWKAEGSYVTRTGDFKKYEGKYTFQIRNSANVEVVEDLTEYDANQYVKQNFQNELNNIQIVELFGLA